ncbi:MAG TPA: EsaB/YukD family protein [Pyrinomonadaceae bacterium]|nr:EsaB/YukD family protein [Pyrinomonadaceae bacterium]
MSINVALNDHNLQALRQAKISETATVARLIPALITQLELPTTDGSGRPVTYHLLHGERILEEDETLTSAGIVDGDTLTIVPEITAPPIDKFTFESLKRFRDQLTGPCALYGIDRQQVIQEITEAVEARLLVTIIKPKQETTQQDGETHSAMVVRPVFGAPVSSVTVDCDVFMMMPFAEAFQSIYEDYIKPLATDANLRIQRADDFFTQHNIMNEIWTALCLCQFAIADCTGRNPNVLYELGIAHTLGRRVILLAQSMKDIPFDVQGRRVIIYQDNSSGLKRLRDQLSRAIELTLAELQIDKNGPPT